MASPHFFLASRTAAEAQPVSVTSTGVADVKTSLTAPKAANAMLLSAKTTAARVAFAAKTGNPATPQGLVIPAGVAPVFLPFAADISFCSDIAGNSELTVVWLEQP